MARIAATSSISAMAFPNSRLRSTFPCWSTPFTSSAGAFTAARPRRQAATDPADRRAVPALWAGHPGWRAPGRRCRKGFGEGLTIDLLTVPDVHAEIPRQGPGCAVIFRNALFFNGKFSHNYYATMKISLRAGALGFPGRDCSQTYPQILWVRNFIQGAKGLGHGAQVESS